MQARRIAHLCSLRGRASRIPAPAAGWASWATLRDQHEADPRRPACAPRPDRLHAIPRGPRIARESRGHDAGLGLTCRRAVEVPITFLGLAIIVRGAVTTLALEWVRRGKPEGLFLARFTALTILLSAPVVYWKLGRVDLASAISCRACCCWCRPGSCGWTAADRTRRGTTCPTSPRRAHRPGLRPGDPLLRQRARLRAGRGRALDDQRRAAQAVGRRPAARRHDVRPAGPRRRRAAGDRRRRAVRRARRTLPSSGRLRRPATRECWPPV